MDTFDEELNSIIDERRRTGVSQDEAEAASKLWRVIINEQSTPDKITEALGVAPAAPENPTEEARGQEEAREATERKAKLREIMSSDAKYNAARESVDSIREDRLREIVEGDDGVRMIRILASDQPNEGYLEKLRDLRGATGGDLRIGLQRLINEIEDNRPKPARVTTQQVIQQQEDARKKRQEKQNPPEPQITRLDEADTVEELIENLEGLDINDAAGLERFKGQEGLRDVFEMLQLKVYFDDLNAGEAVQNRFNQIQAEGDVLAYRGQMKAFLRTLLQRAHETQNDPRRRAESAEDRQRFLRERRMMKRGTRFNVPEGIDDDFFENSEQPRSVQELAVWIMASDDEHTWGINGPHALFGKKLDENGKEKADMEKFNAGNFMMWLRNKLLEHHGDNANDQISPLSQITIQTLYRPVNLIEMKYNKQQYFSDQEEAGRLLDEFYNEVIDEAFVFGVRRNNDLRYRQVMTSDDKLPEAVVEVNSRNEHTNGPTLRNYMAMGEAFDPREGNKDHKVGDAIILANQIYRNLSNYRKLREILPDDAPLFTSQGFRDAFRVLNNQGFDKEITGYGPNIHVDGQKITFINAQTKVRTVIFNERGELTDPKNLILALNIFPEANPDDSKVLLTRELVKITVGKIIGFDTATTEEGYEAFRARVPEQGRAGITPQAYRKLTRINLDFAETNAWVEQRWNGAAARNDTGFRGYDAWTKMYAQYYRERQSGPGTAGPIGNPYDIPILKLLSPDMWLAIKTESGVVVQKIMEDINNLNVREVYPAMQALEVLRAEETNSPEGLSAAQQAEKTRLESHLAELNSRRDAHSSLLRFAQGAQADWAGNGFKRHFDVWHGMLETEDIAFGELVKRDAWGIPRFSRGKAEEIINDKFIKERRYAFKSNGAIDYGVVTESPVKVPVYNEKGERTGFRIEIQDMMLADAMFGHQIMDPLRKDWYTLIKRGDGKKEGKLTFTSADESGVGVKKDFTNATFQEYLSSNEARDRILKNVCRAGLAAQIKAHREWKMGAERWDSEAIRNIYDILRSSVEHMEDPDNPGHEIPIEGSRFFSEEDIKWIQEQTKTTPLDLLQNDMGKVSWEAASAVPEMFKIFFKEVFAS